MREIKFRAWDKKLKEMYIPDLIYGGKSAELNRTPDAQDFDSNTDILLQYTGLKDKNGKEIYEGDIVIDYTQRKYPIEFFNGMFSAMEGKWHHPLNPYCEIIGNIYENPELLK